MNIQFRSDVTKEVYIRFSMSDYDRLKAVADAEHTKLSEVIRVFTVAALEEYEHSKAGGTE